MVTSSNNYVLKTHSHLIQTQNEPILLSKKMLIQDFCQKIDGDIKFV